MRRRPLIRLAVVLALAAAVQACSRGGEGGPQQEPKAPAGADDLCGADDLQWLVGRLRTMAPVTADMSRRRITCTTCPAPAEYDPARVNVLYDLKSGVVKEVRCG
ncbi:hypothetical protein [Caulobacter sp. 17J65-9]|uniref:hypothetical protein n=1 Tax=Caulobacter sp. 17J65-9 TaxID=2709382 RepID=UPI0013C55D9B|nr:hypothetical protein [Caulobacter sp. 17J65-9]NEX91325.1 hypothetical protein [Caulobacter sp. 17J65-9]